MEQQMRKRFLFLVCFILFYPLLSFGQINSLEVTYSIKLAEKKNNISHNKLISAFEKSKFILKTTHKESIFNAVKSMSNDESQESLISKIYLKSDDVFYSNLITKINLVQKEIFGNTYLIKSYQENNWNLKNETKKIGDYLCLKAIKTISVENFKGEISELEIEAWYAPELNFSSGPFSYGNLPGLILEMKKGNLIFYASNLKQNIINIVIEAPKDGILISEKDFEALSKEMYMNRGK